MPEGGIDSRSRFGAFLSYARHDDENDNRRITAMRESLAAEVGLLLGKPFDIFQDRDSISTGEPWNDRIFESLAQSILLIAVITPAFLRSSFCREEVQAFRKYEQLLDRDGLIIPILYMPTPGLADPDDEVAAVLSTRQWFPWGDLHLVDLESNEMRRGIAELAQKVVKAVDRSGSQLAVSRTHRSTPVVQPDDEWDNEEPGFLELLAEGEDAFPLLNMALRSVADLTREIGNITDTATSDLQNTKTAQRPAAARVIAARHYAYQLESPVSQLETVADEYLDQLDRADGAIGALTDLVKKQSAEDGLLAARRFLTASEELAATAATGKQSTAKFRQAVENNYNASKSLRPILKRLSGALQRIEARYDVYVAWRDNLSEALEENEQGDPGQA